MCLNATGNMHFEMRRMGVRGLHSVYHQPSIPMSLCLAFEAHGSL